MAKKTRKTRLKDITARQFIDRARLHVCCFLMSSLTRKDFNFCRPIFEGSAGKGSLTYDNKSGDGFCLYWNDGEIVAGVFDHESQRSNANDDWPPNDRGLTPAEDPRYFFANFPEDRIQDLNFVLDKLKAACGDLNLTAVLWSESADVYSPEPIKQADDNGLWVFENYRLNLKEALGDRDDERFNVQKDFYFSALVGDIVTPKQPNAWMNQYTLSSEQLELAYDLAQRISDQKIDFRSSGFEGITLSSDDWKKFKTIDPSIVDSVTGKPCRAVKENFSKIREQLEWLGIKVS